MNFDEAKELLEGCVRHELRDHAFGDTEVTWRKDGVIVAHGYFSGSSAYVTIASDLPEGDPMGVSTSFHGDLSREMRNCGTEGSISRNDETGPDDFVEGDIQPGLSIGDVFTELTGGYLDED